MKVDYLRISVTDRCNLKCVYCDPLGSCEFITREDILRFEEIHRIACLFAKCGIRKIRLTGGEPLVRKNIVELVRKLACVDGIEELTLTTNGVVLEQMAAELKAAGIKRVNISVDSINTESYTQITGADVLPAVIRSIHKAIEVGLTPVKVNSVIIKNLNDGAEQINALAQMSIDLPVTVRFIEYCQTDEHTRPASDYVATSEVRDIIERRFGRLCGIVTRNSNGPALYYKIKNSAGLIGFISGKTSVFCSSCSRLRLTSDGKIKPCLYSDHYYDIKKLIRDGTSDEQLLVTVKAAIEEKHKYTKLNSFAEDFLMRRIGG